MLRGVRFGQIARAAARRPWLVLAVFAVFVAAGVALSLTLRASATTETLVDEGSDSFEATEAYEQKFGGDAVIVLVRGDLQNTLLTENFARLLSLEGCLSGQPRTKPGAPPPPPVCREIAESGAVETVYGPATFIDAAVNEIAKSFAARQADAAARAKQAAELARAELRRRGRPAREQRAAAQAASDQIMEEFAQQTYRLAVRYGISSLPSVDDPSFVSQVIFDTSKGANVPKSRFAYLFPSGRAAVVQVRLRPDLSEEERARAVALVRQATAAPAFTLARQGEYVVTGVPVIEESLAREVLNAVSVLLAAGLLVMVIVLPLVFRSRLRLLPLVIAVGAAALTFGILALVGGSLTMASIAALPVLIGLSVDYAIQYQARFDEALAAGPPRRRRGVGAPAAGPGEGLSSATPGEESSEPGSPAEEAAVRAASVGGPIIATAGLASALGFLVLLLSPVPMVRGFAVLIVGGVALALVCALTVGTAALVRLRPRWAVARPARGLRRAGSRLPGLSRLRDRAADLRARLAERARTAVSASLRLSTTRPRQVLAVGLALALLGVVVDTQTRVVSDVRELVSEDMQALKDLNALTETTGVAGEVDVTVTADDLFRPEVMRWMDDFQRDALAAHGYRSGKTCVQERNPPELCPGFSLPDLLRLGANQGGNVRGLIEAVPRYFSQAVISDDRRTANIAFGIRLMPLERQQEVIDDLRERLESAPAGVTAEVAGAPVLVAEGNAAVASPWRRLATLVFGLAAVLGVLWAVRRRFEDAAVPLIPIALAVGWSALVLFLLRIPLNPLSVGLGGLVIAISTEFGVLLSARYNEERAAGFEAPEALRRTFDSTGAAVLASGVTAIAGFAALIASDFTMLRDFGIVTVVDLTVSLLGVMIVLPAALVWAEENGPFEVADLDPRRWGRAIEPSLRRGLGAARARLDARPFGRRSRSGA